MEENTSEKKKQKENKEKTEVEMDFRVSPVGMQKFFEIYDFSAEDAEACVDFFEKFVVNDFPRYLKAQQALRTYVNAALCVGDDDLRDHRIEVLGRIDVFMMDLAAFSCRFSGGYING